MHRLSQHFIDELAHGSLAPVRERVLADRTLCLEIRDDYLNIYYRGGNLLKVASAPSGYSAFFDKRYARGDGGDLARVLPPSKIRTSEHLKSWLKALPLLKQAIDLHSKNPEEREAQQHVLRDNNFGGISRATDYYVCDIEYANHYGQFDLVAVHWPSTSAKRKQTTNRRLVLGEVKYGDAAIAGKAGIHDHIVDINHFLEDEGRVQALKGEMVELFNQKRALGLVNCGQDLSSFSDETPMLLLILINHDPDKDILRRVLESMPTSPHADIFIATSCFMGYGLFDQGIMPLSEARARMENCF